MTRPRPQAPECDAPSVEFADYMLLMLGEQRYADRDPECSACSKPTNDRRMCANCHEPICERTPCGTKCDDCGMVKRYCPKCIVDTYPDAVPLAGGGWDRSGSRQIWLCVHHAIMAQVEQREGRLLA